MKTGLTRIVVLIDRSGSMESVRDATVAGINEFLVSQKAQPGEATVKLVQFDDHEGKLAYDTIFDKKLSDVTILTQGQFTPRGSTPLRDAIGRTINGLGAELNALNEEERPERVIVCIVTDGYENASKEFSATQIKSMVEHQTSKYSWKFTYVGANQDAVLVAKDYGISAMNAMSFTADAAHTKSAFRGISAYLGRVRSASSSADALKVGYSGVERLDSVDENDIDKANIVLTDDEE